MAHLNHFQVISIRQRRERTGGQGLVPIGDGGQVVLQREVAAAAAPAEGLDGDLEVALKADRVGDVPAVHAKARLRAIDAIGPDDLVQSAVGRAELLVLLGLRDLEVVRAAKVIFGPRGNNGGWTSSSR